MRDCLTATLQLMTGLQHGGGKNVLAPSLSQELPADSVGDAEDDIVEERTDLAIMNRQETFQLLAHVRFCWTVAVMRERCFYELNGCAAFAMAG